MVSMLSWLDHDRDAAERSMRMLSFFKEREARDELGIGGVRDAIADQLFPGTSTIQTRLRYVFFIPWLYAQLEQKNISSASYAGAARQAEGRLLQALIDNEPATETGVIGREAGSTLPSRRVAARMALRALAPRRWSFHGLAFLRVGIIACAPRFAIASRKPLVS